MPRLDDITVLVVDDDADGRALVSRILQERGARTCLAGSAAEALAVLGRERIHLMLSDIGMPDRDGYELIHDVRALDSAKSMPAIAVTAYARPEGPAAVRCWRATRCTSPNRWRRGSWSQVSPVSSRSRATSAAGAPPHCEGCDSSQLLARSAPSRQIAAPVFRASTSRSPPPVLWLRLVGMCEGDHEEADRGDEGARGHEPEEQVHARYRLHREVGPTPPSGSARHRCARWSAPVPRRSRGSRWDTSARSPHT